MSLKQESKLIQANIKEVLSGKSSAYEQLYRVHTGRIYTFSLKFFDHSKQAAEELTRRVFIKAYEQINSYPENITFILWLKRLAIEEIRKRDIKKSDEIHQASPADEAIYSLPEEERLVFILSDVEKLTAEEIEEITQNSSDYINEQLELARKAIMERLKIDSVNKIDYKISFFSIKSEPREDLWETIYNQILSIATKDLKKEENGEVLNIGDAKTTLGEKLQKIREEKKSKTVFLKLFGLTINLKASLTLIIIILLTATIWTLFLFNSTEWEVINISGSPAVKTNYKIRIVANTTLLSKNELLTTDQNSTAVIKISKIGDIYINPGSSVQRVNEKGELLIYSGDVKIVKKKDSDPFPVEVLSAKIEDFRAGSYSIKKSNNKAVVYSESAGLLITSGDREIYVLPGYTSEILPKGKVGIAYSQNASSEYIFALNDFSFEEKKDKLNIILLLSEKKDALTLFNLLLIVDKSSRNMVINKLQSLVSLPKDINPRQMSNLNEDDLEKWLDSIEKIN